MIAALLTTLWVIVAIAVFSALAWPAPGKALLSRVGLAVAMGLALAWPIVAALAVSLAFLSVLTDDGRNDLED